jgi:hypothetical protein
LLFVGNPFTTVKENIDAYHIAEKQEALFMIGWGGVWVAMSIVALLYAQDELYVGIAYSIIPLGVLQLIGGLRNLFSYSSRYSSLIELLKTDWRKAAEVEKLRVLNIQIRIRFYKIGEQTLFVVGLLLLLIGGIGGWRVFLVGSGIGLLLMSAVLMIQDLFSAWRSGIYLSELQSFIDDE